MSTFPWGFTFLITGVCIAIFLLVFPLFIKSPKNKPSLIWLIGLLLGTTSFVYATFFLVSRTSIFNFQESLPFFKSVPLAVAPMLFTAYFLQPLFLRSARASISFYQLLVLAIPLFLQYSLVLLFSSRVLSFSSYANLRAGFFMSLQLALGFLYVTAWLLYETRQHLKINQSFVLRLVYIFTGLIVGVTIAWLFFLLFDLWTNQAISEGLGGILSLDINNRILRMGFYTIVEILLTAYWVQNYSAGAIEERLQKERVQALLTEKDALIMRLSNEGALIETGALSAGLAHELNQFLAMIELNSDEALHQMDQVDVKIDDLKPSIQNILSANHSAASLISSLRMLFKSNHSDLVSCDLDTLVSDVTLLYRERLKKSNIQLKLDLTVHKKWVVWESLLRQVIVNLLSNAIEALDATSRDGKTIIISSEIDEKGQYQLRVQDNGPGIHPNQENKLFNLFGTSKSGGTGIGLWLSQYIAERHKGKLHYFNLPNHGGVSFILTIPPDENS